MGGRAAATDAAAELQHPTADEDNKHVNIAF